MPKGCWPVHRSLIVTRGLPAAGKTTRALRWVAEDPDHRARVGSDEIAAMLHPQVMLNHDTAYGPQYALREQLVVNAAIEVLLRSGIDVVCDDPFLLPHYLGAVRELAERCGAELVIWDMTDVDVKECIARDERRGRAGGPSIGEQAIREQYRLFREHQQVAAAVSAAEVVAPTRGRVVTVTAEGRQRDGLVDVTVAGSGGIGVDGAGSVLPPIELLRTSGELQYLNRVEHGLCGGERAEQEPQGPLRPDQRTSVPARPPPQR
jgi:predicted kinase